MLLAIGGTFLIATHGPTQSIGHQSQRFGLGSGVSLAYALYIILPLNLIQNGEACW